MIVQLNQQYTSNHLDSAIGGTIPLPLGVSRLCPGRLQGWWVSRSIGQWVGWMFLVRMCWRIISTALSLRNKAVPFRVGKPAAAHVAAETIHERITPSRHDVSPSCVFRLFMVRERQEITWTFECPIAPQIVQVISCRSLTGVSGSSSIQQPAAEFDYEDYTWRNHQPASSINLLKPDVVSREL